MFNMHRFNRIRAIPKYLNSTTCWSSANRQQARYSSLMVECLKKLSSGPNVPEPLRARDVITILHMFPAMEPMQMTHYPWVQLGLPFRIDLIQRAVVYEADGARQGTASTKRRHEVHGSNRKIRPQKGTGRARLGDKKSPMLRGGGRAFGPKPRDFSTKLNRKIYDLAMRTALSHLYRSGQLILVQNQIELPLQLHSELNSGNIPTDLALHYHDVARDLFLKLGWEKRRSASSTYFVTNEERPSLTMGINGFKDSGRVAVFDKVTVGDLLRMDRVVIEREALDNLLATHQSDLTQKTGFCVSQSEYP